jgi:short-subunit dehydrogenase
LYHDLSLMTDQVSASVLCPYFVPTNIDKKSSSPIENVRGFATPSQAVGEKFVARSVSAGKVTAPEVAQMVFDALSKDQFYIYTEKKTLGVFKTRADDILSGRNPTNPSKPEIHELLSQTLKKAYAAAEAKSL